MAMYKNLERHEKTLLIGTMSRKLSERRKKRFEMLQLKIALQLESTLKNLDGTCPVQEMLLQW